MIYVACDQIKKKSSDRNIPRFFLDSLLFLETSDTVVQGNELENVLTITLRLKLCLSVFFF